MNDDYENDPTWHYSETWGWYWEKKKAPEESKKPRGKKDAKDEQKKTDVKDEKNSKDDKSEKKSKRKAEDMKGEAPARKSRSKTKAEASGSSQPSKPSGKRTVSKTTKNGDEAPKPKKMSKGEKQLPTGMDPAPQTRKEQRKEIYEFLLACKDFTDDNAKDNLKQMVHPNFRNSEVAFRMNIYWYRKNVWGAGVGVKSLKENKDFAFYGYKTRCDSWIFAIAAAIKSADILAPFKHINVFIYVFITHARYFLASLQRDVCAYAPKKNF